MGGGLRTLQCDHQSLLFLKDDKSDVLEHGQICSHDCKDAPQ